MPWNEDVGAVTRAFDEWKSTDREIRAYLLLSQRWVDAAYETEWQDAKEEFSRVFDPDFHDPDDYVDLFDSKVSGLWAKDYFWMVRSGALRDAVTAFEIYLEKSIQELLGWWALETEGGRQHLGFAQGRGQFSPLWGALKQTHEALGTDVHTSEIEYVRALRHLLTHQRGKLRSEELRDRFVSEANDDDWLVGDARVGGDVPLATERVLAMMDQLAAVVRAADGPIWHHTWGKGDFPEALLSLTEGPRARLAWHPEQAAAK